MAPSERRASAPSPMTALVPESPAELEAGVILRRIEQAVVAVGPGVPAVLVRAAQKAMDPIRAALATPPEKRDAAALSAALDRLEDILEALFFGHDVAATSQE
jgi:hypothetical protein